MQTGKGESPGPSVHKLLDKINNRKISFVHNTDVKTDYYRKPVDKLGSAAVSMAYLTREQADECAELFKERRDLMYAQQDTQLREDRELIEYLKKIRQQTLEMPTDTTHLALPLSDLCKHASALKRCLRSRSCPPSRAAGASPDCPPEGCLPADCPPPLPDCPPFDFSQYLDCDEKPDLGCDPLANKLTRLGASSYPVDDLPITTKSNPDNPPVWLPKVSYLDEIDYKCGKEAEFVRGGQTSGTLNPPDCRGAVSECPPKEPERALPQFECPQSCPPVCDPCNPETCSPVSCVPTDPCPPIQCDPNCVPCPPPSQPFCPPGCPPPCDPCCIPCYPCDPCKPCSPICIPSCEPSFASVPCSPCIPCPPCLPPCDPCCDPCPKICDPCCQITCGPPSPNPKIKGVLMQPCLPKYQPDPNCDPCAPNRCYDPCNPVVNKYVCYPNNTCLPRRLRALDLCGVDCSLYESPVCIPVNSSKAQCCYMKDCRLRCKRAFSKPNQDFEFIDEEGKRLHKMRDSDGRTTLGLMCLESTAFRGCC